MALKHPIRLWLPLGVAIVVLAVGVLALSAGGSSRVSLYNQLQQPATFARVSVGPGPVSATMHSHAYRLDLGMSPNRASARDRLSVRLMNSGAPLNGARVTVNFSMPSMNMYDGLSSRLVQTGQGTYSASEPVLGMPGVWRMQLHVQPRDGAAFTVAVDDHMVG